ncbi:hypothetical protein E4U19_003824 [Claviceps sp. Clav32 group G5]|nr:hypothetical protein E4U19_003824 [Claviceps sp. Clav32 group G5]KAG6043263.1 hypothetical protein E4U39_004767 [Claviceps sp. Clav50 group G5]
MAYVKVASFFLLSQLVAAAHLLPKSPACLPVHMMVARGSLEAAGTGILQSLVQEISKKHPSSTVEPIDYPAGMDDYDVSVTAGTQAVKKQITSYVERCPNSQVVVLGFSQGAHITGDALCGGVALDTGVFTPPLSHDIGSHISAIVWYGDPRYVPGKPFNKGNATTEGMFAREGDQSCDKYSDVLASYCDEGDAFCATTGDDLIVHLTYPNRYDGMAAEFVKERLASRHSIGR